MPAATVTTYQTRWLTAALLTGVLASAFEAYGTLTAMPSASRQLGNIELYAWTSTAFVIAQLLAIVAAGRLSDRMGPVRPLLLGGTVFLAGLAIAGFAPNMATLLVARFVQGFGSGAMNLTLMVVVGVGYGDDKRADLMGWFSFCWVLPAFVGPPIAAWITQRFSWHWVFLGVIPIVVGAAIIGARALRDLDRRHGPARYRARPTSAGQAIATELSADRSSAGQASAAGSAPGESASADPDVSSAVTTAARPVKLWAAVVTALAAAAFQYAGQHLSWISLPIAVAGLAGLVVAVPRLMPDGFLRAAPGLPAAVAARMFGAGAFFASENFLTLLLTARYQLELTQAGLYMILGSAGWTVGSFVQARKWVTWSRDRLVQIGMVILVLGTALMAASALIGLPVGLVALGFVLAGTGMGLVVSVVSLANIALSEPGELGRNTSSLQVSDAIGNAVVTGLAGTIFVALRLQAGPAHTFAAIYALATLVGGWATLLALRIGFVANRADD